MRSQRYPNTYLSSIALQRTSLKLVSKNILLYPFQSSKIVSIFPPKPITNFSNWFWESPQKCWLKRPFTLFCMIFRIFGWFYDHSWSFLFICLIPIRRYSEFVAWPQCHACLFILTKIYLKLSLAVRLKVRVRPLNHNYAWNFGLTLIT